MARNGFHMPQRSLSWLFKMSTTKKAQMTARNAVMLTLARLVSGAAMALCISTPTFAAEKFYNYVGIRGLGMGGAQINTVNDETAILVNPAGLGKLRQYYLTVLDPEVAGNNLTMQSASGDGMNAFQDPQVLLDYLNKNPNRYYYARVQLMPSFVLNNFGIGAYAIETHAGQVNQATSTFNLNWRQDVGGVLAYNLRIWEGRIKLGVAARAFNRIDIRNVTMSSTSTGLKLENIANEGGAIAADGGLILTAPIRFLPSISAVVRDIGNTEFSVGKGQFLEASGQPNTQKQSVDVGFALFPILGKHYRMTIAGEFRDIQSDDADDRADALRRAHAGVEFNIGDVLFVRGGMHQRYWTAGFEIATEHFQFQAASYGQEIGTAAATKEDRRYTGKIVFRY
jgi:hypothetical protein